MLCAGLGTRLRPLTERWPKPALPFLGAPLIRYHFALLQRAGVREVGVNTHHLPDVMRAVAEEEAARAGLRLHVSHEPEIQGTGGGIRGLRDLLDGGDFVVLNGDTLFALDLPEVMRAHEESGAAATMVLLPMPERETYAAVETDPAGRVRRIAGRGPGGEELAAWHFTGVHVMSPQVFNFMSPSGPEDINRDVYVRMLEAGLHVRGHVVRTYWSDLGTPSRYLATVRDALEERVPFHVFGGAAPLQGFETPVAGVWRHPLAQMEPESCPRGPARLDAGCRVDAGAQLGAVVDVAERAHVGRGASLELAAVFPDTEVRPGEQLRQTLAWGPHRIPAPL